VELGELDYAAAVYPLLARFPERFAAGVCFLSDGPVHQLLGMLSRALGQSAQATRQLEAAIAASEAADLQLRATEARIQAAGCLLDGDRSKGRRERARQLANEARVKAEQLGMQHMAAEASVLLKRAAGEPRR
jgi:hypothetical protein